MMRPSRKGTFSPLTVGNGHGAGVGWGKKISICLATLYNIAGEVQQIVGHVNEVVQDAILALVSICLL